MITFPANDFRKKLFYFTFGLGISNILLFNTTYMFCEDRVKRLKIELDEIKSKIDLKEDKNKTAKI